MVKLTVGTSQWSGVMIDPSGLILTTSTPLSTSPLVTFQTTDGVTGQAWVQGRDDSLDLALLKVINPSQTFNAVQVATEDPPTRTEDLVMIQYKPSGTSPDTVTTGVVGSRQDASTGIDYYQLQGFASGSEAGGGVFDASGKLRGLRMSVDQMVAIGVGRVGEAWAMNSFPLAASLIPKLQSGYSNILAVAGTCTILGAPPPIPSIYNGDITVGGNPAPTGDRLYAKVTKASGTQLWFSQQITTAGRYFMTISICDSTYDNSPVEFWMDAVKSPVPSTYAPGEKRTPTITFP